MGLNRPHTEMCQSSLQDELCNGRSAGLERPAYLHTPRWGGKGSADKAGLETSAGRLVVRNQLSARDAIG